MNKVSTSLPVSSLLNTKDVPRKRKSEAQPLFFALFFLIFISLGTSAQFFNLKLELRPINSRDFSLGRTVIEAV